MLTEHEEMFDIPITYDSWVKKEMEAYRAWMPFTYGLTGRLATFINDHFYLDKVKPVIVVWIGYDYASHNRDIELSVKIREAGYGEAILFTMDVFTGRYGDSQRDSMLNFVNDFMERFQKNLIRSAVMEKIELYRHPPKPIIDWTTTRKVMLTMAKTAIRLSLAFVIVVIFIIYFLLVL